MNRLPMKMKLVRDSLVYSVFLYMSFSTVEAATTGEELYMKNCMVCHAYDGRGAMPGILDLEQERGWSLIEENVLVNRLKQGIQKKGRVSMPPQGGNPNLTDSDLKKIIRYMRQEFLK